MKYSALSYYETVHDLSLSHLDMEDAARRAPPVGVGTVARLAEAGSILRLVNEEEGYDPTVSFKESLNDIDKAVTVMSVTNEGGTGV